MIMIKRFIALIFTLLVLEFSPSLANEGFIVETLKKEKAISRLLINKSRSIMKAN